MDDLTSGVLALLSFLCFVAVIAVVYLPDSDDPLNNFCGEIDGVSFVEKIVDGDTFDTTDFGRIRLADVDAPEYYEDDYKNAKDYLSFLINERTVCLDIDDMYRTGKYDRLICVVYVEFNSTHYLNVNQKLLDEGLVEVSDYENEFNPNFWNTYELIGEG